MEILRWVEGTEEKERREREVSWEGAYVVFRWKREMVMLLRRMML